ncbi:hypothetical protein J437_LFUL008172 [Ladona fulva]|uniref:Uncharacterized protein n=1 Tax=Ladona fulva TaxID=123851 RepID=A0A8K0KNZ3_LADFU|nr:hypothetical protein J437_LFUL008172 [Ladona fulva]
MKAYEKIDKSIAKAALQKISQHLWYLTDEVSVLSPFDDDLDKETKVKMVENLTKENLSTHGKRYIPSKEDLCGPLYVRSNHRSIVLKLMTVFYEVIRFKKEGFNAEGSERCS